MTDTDLELLARFTRDRADEAFAELVRRHLNLVHSAALRQVRSPQLAEEVAQSTFLKLAQHARQLAPGTVLSAWLYQVTRREAIDVVRREARRQLREQIATEMNAMNATAADWTHIEPLLDDAMAALEETDRTAVLLRYFENKSLREVGEALGASENAVQKRLTRAVERLREFFAKQGVAASASSLVAIVSANAVLAAPVGLTVTISTAVALTGISLATTVTVATHTTMNWINIKSITAILVAALGTGTATYLVQQREANRLLAENQDLAARQVSAAGERDAVLAVAKSTKDELERLRKDQAELLRLRGEVGRMRLEFASQKTQAGQQPLGVKPGQPVATPPGTYITRDQLANVGYATPEAALQTFTWAMYNATYDQVIEGLGSEELASEEKDPEGRSGFESHQKVMSPLFKGLQVVARKQLADDKVELKVKIDADPVPGQDREISPFKVQPMVKVGDAWKIGGSTRGHDEAWEKDGQIQTFTP